MKKFYYVILSMIAIALVSCTSELDEINNTVHQQETLSGNELGANLMKSFQNAVSRSSEIKHLSYPSYYGGAYLNKEGKLVVKVVNKTSEEIEKDLTHEAGKQEGDNGTKNGVERNPFIHIAAIFHSVPQPFKFRQYAF